MKVFICILSVVTIILFVSDVSTAQTYIGGAITTNTTLSIDGSPYIVTSHLHVYHGDYVATLTIEPGVELRFEPGTGLYLGRSFSYFKYYGHLEANGTPDNRIVFTSNAPVPQPGDWVGIKYHSYTLSDSLLYCDIKYAGAVDTLFGVAQAGVYFRGQADKLKQIKSCTIDSILGSGVFMGASTDTLELVDCSITNCTGYGIYDYGRSAYSSIENCTISSNDSGGIHLISNYFDDVVYRNNTINYNGGYPIQLHNQRYVVNLESNTYVGNTNQTIRLTTPSYMLNTTIHDDGLPYEVASHLHVYAGTGMSTLTIAPGVELRFEPGTGLYLGRSFSYFKDYGHLEANGTPDNRIVFTSNAPVPQPGDWVGIKYHSYTLSDSLLYCDIKYAGAVDTLFGVAQAGVYARSKDADYPKIFRHCLIANNLNCGVYCSIASEIIFENCHIIGNVGDGLYNINASRPLIIGGSLDYSCDIYDNTDFNIVNSSGTSTNAQYNYWGTTDSATIAAGISGPVNWIPWAYQSQDLPHIALSTENLIFQGAENSVAPTEQTFSVSNTGGGTLDWYIDEQISWLDITPYFGTSNSQEITATINTTSLAPGTYNEVMTVTSSNADNSPQFVTVEYTVSAGPHISLTPTNLSFLAVQDDPTPTPQTFEISNTGGGTLDWYVDEQIEWLDLDIRQGPGNSQEITVTINTTGLAPGTYNEVMTVTSSNADNSPQFVTVEYTVSAGPHISLTPTNLSFLAVQDDPTPTPQTFEISNTGGGTLDWHIDEQIDWLDITPFSGTSNYAEITVTVNTTGLAPATYNEVMTVTSTNADNSPEYLAIEYAISSGPHIQLSPSSLHFAAAQNDVLPDNQTLTITNTGGGTLDWYIDEQIPWLDIDLYYGTSNYQEITVTINTTDLNPGTYNEVMTVTSSNADNSPEVVSVTYQVHNPDGTPVELAQYDFIKDRLENLEIDLFVGTIIPIPVVNSYEMQDANSFVDNVIRPGYPTEVQLETFQRLLMVAKLVNAGYRYIPDAADPPPETETVRGAEEMWDSAVKNTISAITPALAFLALGEKGGMIAKLLKKVLKTVLGYILDIFGEIRRFIPDEDVRRTWGMLFDQVKAGLINCLASEHVSDCLINNAAVRIVFDEAALSLIHVPSTQDALDDAGSWSTVYNYSNTLEEATDNFQDRWSNIKDMTDQSAAVIAQHEEDAGGMGVAERLQELSDAMDEGFFKLKWVKKAVELFGDLVGVNKSGHSIMAAGEALETAISIQTEITLGAFFVYHGTAPPMYPMHTPGMVLAAGNTRSSSASKAPLPQEISAYSDWCDSVTAAALSGDSLETWTAAESLIVSADLVMAVFSQSSGVLTSKADSGRATIPDFDAALEQADTAITNANLRLLQGSFVALGLQLNPFDAEFNTLSTSTFDTVVTQLADSWMLVDSVIGLLIDIPAVPTLSITATPEWSLVTRDSLVTIDLTVRNIGDAVATGVYCQIHDAGFVTIHSSDSVPLPDLQPGEEVPATYTVSLNWVPSPVSFYQTSLLNIVAFPENGIGGQVAVALMAATSSCGDIDGSGTLPIDIADLVYLVDFMFNSGPEPPVMEAADVDASGGLIDIADLVYLVDYMFNEGPEPTCP